LMTPEEILNIPTPESVLNITDPDEAKLTTEERYLRRKQRSEIDGLTNNLSHTGAFWHGDTATDALGADDTRSRFGATFGGAVPNFANNPNTLFGGKRSDAANQSDSAWGNPFGGAAQPLPEQTPDQLAGMKRFRELMEPSAPPKPQDSAFGYQPATAAPVNPNFNVLPQENPAGRSFTPLKSDLTRPMGLTPLPGISGPRQVSTAKPKPLLQAPPWMSDTPQPFTPLQRHF